MPDHSKHEHHEHMNHDHSNMNHENHEHHGMHQETQQAATMDHSMHGGHGHHGAPADVSAVLLGTLLLFLGIGTITKNKKSKWLSKRFDLFRIPGFEKAVKSKYFSFLFRLIPALLFILVLAAGIFGRERANFAAPFTWLFWWTLLIFFVAFGGKIFCAACPWDFFANLFQFGWFHKLKGRGQSLGLKYPKALKNIYIAVIFFIVLTWLEIGAEIAYDSYATAMLGVFVVVFAILSALIFEKRAFCRYACPIGRISGIYSQFSPLELRVKKQSVCTTCESKICTRGTATTTPCPTGEIPFKLKQSTYCTLCTECVRSCDKNNLTLKLRPPGYDLHNISTARNDESVLIKVILVLTFFHGLTMIPTWFEWTTYMEKSLGMSYIVAFSILMTAILGACFFLFKVLDRFIENKTGHHGLSGKMVYAFVPLILGYHIGHNAMHITGESLHLVPLINDPFGYGWNLFGWKDFKAFPLAGHDVMRWVQLGAIAIGFYYSIKILKSRSEKINQTFATTSGQSSTLYLSHYLLLIAVGLIGVWFVFQPMVMRSSYQ